jgi:hypothetical protein
MQQAAAAAARRFAALANLERLLAHQSQTQFGTCNPSTWCLPPSLCSRELSSAAVAVGATGLSAGAAAWAVQQQQQQQRRHISIHHHHHHHDPRRQYATGSGGGSAPGASELAGMDAVHLRGLLFHGFHGVLPEVRASAP